MEGAAACPQAIIHLEDASIIGENSRSLPVPIHVFGPKCGNIVKKAIRPEDGKVRINTPFSIRTLHKVFSSLGSEKRALIDSIGFGGLLKIQNQRLHCRELILFLLRSMDPKTGTIALRSGELPLNDRDVHLVLGIPFGGHGVQLGVKCPETLEKVKVALLLEVGTELTMEVVTGILLKQYSRKMNAKEREAFKVAAIIFVDSCFMGPRGDKRRINKDILEHVADPATIQKTNWSGYVLGVLRQSAAKVQQSITNGQRTVTLDGCLLFLLVFYLDNLSAGFLSPAHDMLPRIAKYTPHLVSELVAYDRRRKMPHSIVEFGRAKLRGRQEVIYSRCHVTKALVSPSSADLMYSRTSPRRRNNIWSLDNHYDQQSQFEGRIEYNEAQVAFEEYLTDFSTQVAHATEELRRKVHILFERFPPPVGSSPVRARADHQAEDKKEQSLNTHTGLRSQSSSSSGASDNGEYSSQVWKVVEDEILLMNLPNRPAVIVSGDDIKCIPNLSSDEVIVSRSPFHRTPVLETNLADKNASCHTCFGASPFDLGLKDKDIPLKVIMQVIRLLPKLTGEVRKSIWYKHNAPSTLMIDGESLYRAFYMDFEFETDIIDAAMRLYHDLDNVLYQTCHEKRWRHYLPSTWATTAMSDETFSNIDYIVPMFKGIHVPYQSDECQLVFLPVNVACCWSLYAWDFARKILSIIDPVLSTPELVFDKHNQVARKLHKNLMFCRNEIFASRHYLIDGWEFKYLPANSENTRRNSGLHTVFWSRYFDGQACTRSMTMDDSVTLFQTSLLCQILLSPTNQGSCPIEIMSILGSCS